MAPSWLSLCPRSAWLRRAAHVSVGAALAVTAGAGQASAGTQGGQPGSRPTAIVSIGDSIAAGVGGGDYYPETDRFGDWCLRSPNAVVEKVALPGIDKAVNLACGGALTDNVRLGGWPWFSERPQLERLRDVARDNDVKVITVGIGINDVPIFAVVLHCALSYIAHGPECQRLWDGAASARIRSIEPKMVQVFSDIRTVMRDAGYADDSYQVISSTYASPLGTAIRYGRSARIRNGCPFSDAGTRWAHDVMAPEFNAMVRRVAARAGGVRVFDLEGSFDGRQVCAPGITHADEWARGLFIDPAQLRHGGPWSNLIEQSMHPNIEGYRQMSGCFREFAPMHATEGHCVANRDGNLTARPGRATQTVELRPSTSSVDLAQVQRRNVVATGQPSSCGPR
jgi:lysophospholipase L1-like esterase